MSGVLFGLGAIRAGAQVIVTANLRDFPDSELAQFDIEAKHPDEFVMDLFHLDGVRSIRRSVRQPRPGVIHPGSRLMCVTALRLRGFLYPRPPSVAEQGRQPRVTLHGLVARLRSPVVRR